MIVASREGSLIYADPITEEQREQALVKVFSAFLKQHPEVLNFGMQSTDDANVRLTTDQ